MHILNFSSLASETSKDPRSKRKPRQESSFGAGSSRRTCHADIPARRPGFRKRGRSEQCRFRSQSVLFFFHFFSFQTVFLLIRSFLFFRPLTSRGVPKNFGPKGSKRCFPNGIFQIPHLDLQQPINSF